MTVLRDRLTAYTLACIFTEYFGPISRAGGGADDRCQLAPITWKFEFSKTWWLLVPRSWIS